MLNNGNATISVWKSDLFQINTWSFHKWYFFLLHLETDLSAQISHHEGFFQLCWIFYSLFMVSTPLMATSIGSTRTRSSCGFSKDLLLKYMFDLSIKHLKIKNKKAAIFPAKNMGQMMYCCLVECTKALWTAGIEQIFLGIVVPQVRYRIQVMEHERRWSWSCLAGRCFAVNFKDHRSRAWGCFEHQNIQKNSWHQ